MTYFQFTSQSQHNTPLEYGVQRTEQLECRGKRHNCFSRILTKAVNNNDSQIYNITPTVYIFLLYILVATDQGIVTFSSNYF